jgi:hypothetical protein
MTTVTTLVITKNLAHKNQVVKDSLDTIWSSMSVKGGNDRLRSRPKRPYFRWLQIDSNPSTTEFLEIKEQEVFVFQKLICGMPLSEPDGLWLPYKDASPRKDGVRFTPSRNLVVALEQTRGLLADINPYAWFGLWLAFMQGSRRIPGLTISVSSRLDVEQSLRGGIGLNELVALPCSDKSVMEVVPRLPSLE